MTTPIWERFRCGVAVLLAASILFIGMRTTQAAEETPAPSAATERNAGVPAQEADPAAAPVQAPPKVQLQLQDDAPTPDPDSARLTRRRQSSLDLVEERPFWKNWVFWAITGALVVGAVSLVAYTASKTDSSLAPCPPDVVVSLGCYGAGR